MDKIKYYLMVAGIIITVIIIYVMVGKDQALRYAKQADQWRKKTLESSTKDYSDSMTTIDNKIVIRNDKIEERIDSIEDKNVKDKEKIDKSSIRDLSKEFEKYGL